MALPTDSAERKKLPMYSGLMKYFPDALAEVSRVSYDGNEKHNPGEPLHWSREKSSDHTDCIIRHMADLAGGADPVSELRAVAWRSLAALQIAIEERAKPTLALALEAQVRKTNGEIMRSSQVARNDAVIEKARNATLLTFGLKPEIWTTLCEPGTCIICDFYYSKLDEYRPV